ncbi:MAG: FAD-dependent oxidoreductase [Myxococcales bacterium]|nr:FAD-dependent oxidoreductase [Myxococcales bacterium]MCB9644061.1 FAD-dependent oxidoreductase [Myxococcales bacterium]
MTSSSVLDVAIVGGGVSGVYSGWRLLTDGIAEADSLRALAAQKGGKLDITVFEGSHRIGGRLLSVTPPGMPHIRCELGGMRFTSAQTLVYSLVMNKMQLATHDFPVSEPENIAYVRGKHLRTQELNDSSKIPYNVLWSEKDRDPSTLVAYAVNQIIPGYTNLSRQQARQVLRETVFEGRPLYQWGFWNLLLKVLGQEAFSLAEQASGYNLLLNNWNAADAIPFNLDDFGKQIQYYAVSDGYETVPLTLAEWFEEAGGAIRFGQWLQSFDTTQLPDGTQGVSLKFRDDEGREATILARHLILAMPRHSIERLDQTGVVLDKQNHHVHYLLGAVKPIPMFKIFMCYPYPWWEAVGVTKGQSVTDMPIRQSYYWGVEGRQPGADRNNTNAVLMATYDDGNNVDFWAGLRTNPQAKALFEPLVNRFVDPEALPYPEWRTYRAPRAMVQEIHRQLKVMHGLPYAPEPYDAAYRDWADEPFGGAINLWNIHYKSWEVIPAITQPEASAPVYICGEAYSDEQGWVEGALSTAEIMLSQHFGLPQPDWLSDT